MTALTTMFTFIYVYLRFFIHVLIGGRVSLNSFSGEAYDIAKIVFDFFGTDSVSFRINYVFLIIFGIFVFGSIIGLVRRLTR